MSEASVPAFIRRQRQLARYLRDPIRAPVPPGLDERRAGLYAYAVYANAERFMADNFPRLRAVLDDASWGALVRDYLSRHRAQTSLFIELPLEFMDYLAHERDASDDPPYLQELAHFDWLETLITADERRLVETGVDRDGDLLASEIVLNPIHEFVTYAWPVHRIDAKNRPTALPAQPTILVAFRDRQNAFSLLELNSASARLFEMLRGDPGRSARIMLHDIALELTSTNVDAVIAGGHAILHRMKERELILGTRAAGSRRQDEAMQPLCVGIEQRADVEARGAESAEADLSREADGRG